jgi:mannose-6-phosphate isomerase-like protein (cupin superfamily)
MKPIGAIWGREYARSADDLVMADHTFEITMGVRDRARRQGIGRQLLDRFADMARTEGLSELSLGVHVESRARKLYEAAGYMPILDSEGNEQVLPGNFVAMALELDAPVLRVQTLQEDELSTRALIKLRGRNRTTINHGSTTTYHVLSGEGTMTVDDVMHELKPGVTIEVPPHVPYFDEGNVDMVAVSVPPFNMDDVEVVE